MRIINYHYQDTEEPGWDFTEVQFGKTNLLVGDTATGKSRLLNTIFNLGRFVAAKEFKNGLWEMSFQHDGTTYTWHLETQKRDDERRPGIIIRDNLWKHENSNRIPIIERDNTKFIFAGHQTPRLSPQETSISLLQEEETIRPLHDAFSIVKRRLFNQDALSSVTDMHSIPARLIERLEEKQSLRLLFNAGMNLSANLYLLSRYFADVYKLIVEHYRQIFQFIQEARICSLSDLRPNVGLGGEIPMFAVRERGSDKWIPANELSSGMQKVLLILTDMLIMPNGGVYIIDEYENSLGINAIDFFPPFVLNLEKDVQIILTSHHPYIINEIPLANWYVFHREGMHVSVRYGEAIAKRFSQSKQQAFIQLINDPLYKKGVE